ncbi:MAG: Rieske 2Fe-2S domain-containing protein [Solirubrobacterales bacterium]
MKLETESVLQKIPHMDAQTHTISRGIHAGVLKGGRATRKAADVLHGTWMGHPLHAALTDFTIGAWTLASIFDWIGLLGKSKAAREAADRMIDMGNASAVPTAVAGLVDYSTIPNSAMATGGTHGLLNAVGYVVNLLSASARKSGKRTLGVALSTAVCTGLLASAWLGGEMVYRYKVGVNRTRKPEGPEDWEPVLDESELMEDEPQRIEVQGAPVLLYRHEGDIYAVGAVCGHAAGPLEEGTFDGTKVTCSWHQSVYDVRDGTVVHGPSCYAEPAYDVRVQDGRIELRLSSEHD